MAELNFSQLGKPIQKVPAIPPVSSSNKKPKTVAPISFSSLGKPIKFSSLGSPIGNKEVQDYANQSANPAVTDTNPTPSWWDKVIAGTPFAPADATDTKYDENTSWTKPFVTSAKMLANVFSDAPSILAVIPTAILHPINTVTGLVGAVKNITDESVDAISTGLATGDWSQLGQDVQKTEISVMNHPLQTVLLLDGALESSKNVLRGMIPEGENVQAYRDSLPKSDPMSKSPYGFSGSLGQMGLDTVAKIKGYINDIANAKSNLAKAFTTKSTITEHLATIQQTLSDKVASMKTVEDLKGKLTAFTEKPKADVAGAEAKVNANAGEQEALKNQLTQEQEKLDELNKQHTEQTNKTAADQQAEMKLKSGFESPTDMSSAVSKLFKNAFDRASAVYDKTLGSAKIEVGNIIDALEKYKDELFKGSKTKSADVAQGQIDQLKLRQIVGEGGSEQDIYKNAKNLSKKEVKYGPMVV